MTTGTDTTAEEAEEPRRRLNAPLVRVLMWGAGYETIEQLAAAVNMNKSQLGRAYRGRSAPSLKMVEGFALRFPLVPFTALVRPAGDPLLNPAALGITPEQVAEVYPEDAAEGATG